MSTKQAGTTVTQLHQIYPFFDPYRNGRPLSWSAKISVSVLLGILYSTLQYANLANKSAYFSQYCWVLSIVITTTMLALYIATAVFRSSLEIMQGYEGDTGIIGRFLDRGMVNRNYLLAGLIFATMTTLVSVVLGIPEELKNAAMPLFAIYLGYFVTGFTSGMGLWGIFSVIALYLRFAPNLQHSLDPDNPDGNGGIKALGDSLWFFASLIFGVGVLVAAYMFSVDWTNLGSELARNLFLVWLALPFILAVSIVLIPALAVRRQVGEFKKHRQQQLKRERARVYSSYKEFAEEGDEEIIASKKQLQHRLNQIQNQLERVKQMRSSPIDPSKKS